MLAAAVPRAATVIVAGMHPVLKDSPEDRALQLAGPYVNPTIPLAAQLVDSVSAFVLRAVPARR